jgi:hypothetical protein
MSDCIKFNVIVPTRERADTLLHCLRTLIAQDYENLNIIVSDNFSQDNTRQVVESFADKRITYLNTGKRVSMCHNWEFALEHVTDGWVTFLGDDDGLYPWALRVLNKVVQEHKVEAVSSEFASFEWPGHFKDRMNGRLSIPFQSSLKIKRSREELKRVFSGRLPYTILPSLYQGGAASLRLINSARDENGRFLRSLNPDIYSMVALSCATDRYLAVEMPIAVVGASKHSTGTAMLRSVGAEEEQPVVRFKAEENLPFHESLVLGKSLQICLYECYLQSWHIHGGSLGIELSDQLVVAAKTAPLGTLSEDTWKQCLMIAQKNGIKLHRQPVVWWSALGRLVRHLRTEFWRVAVDPGRLKVVNVYDATVASAYIYEFLRTNTPLSALFLLTTSFIRRTTLKIGRMISGRDAVQW